MAKAYILTPVDNSDIGDMDIYTDLTEAVENCIVLNNLLYPRKMCVWEANIQIHLNKVVH